MVLMDPEDRASINTCHSGVGHPLGLGLLSKSIANQLTVECWLNIYEISVLPYNVAIIIIVKHPSSLRSPLVGELANFKVRLTHGVSLTLRLASSPTSGPLREEGCLTMIIIATL